jgi:protein TIF31
LIDAFVEHRYMAFVRIAAYHLQGYKMVHNQQKAASVATLSDGQADSGRHTRESVATDAAETDDSERIAAQIKERLLAHSDVREQSPTATACDGTDASGTAAGAMPHDEAKRIVDSAKNGSIDATTNGPSTSASNREQVAALDQEAKEGTSTTQMASTATIVAHAAKLVGSLSADDFDIRFNPDCYCTTVTHTDPTALAAQRKLCRDAATFLLANQLPTLVRDCLEHCTSPVDGQGLVDVMHARGINVRYLGKFVQCLSDVAQLDYVASIGMNELLARSVKHVLRTYLQSVGQANVAVAVAHFLNCLFGSNPAPTPSSPPDAGVPTSRAGGKDARRGRNGQSRKPHGVSMTTLSQGACTRARCSYMSRNS